jgi:hypothetical protein
VDLLFSALFSSACLGLIHTKIWLPEITACLSGRSLLKWVRKKQDLRVGVYTAGSG